MKPNTCLKIDHLKEFILLSEELNYTKVARTLHIDQSSLSKHIAELEKALGVTLFNRSSHSTFLSNYGVEFVRHAKLIVSAHDSALLAVDQMKRNADSVLKIGYLRDACRPFISEACNLFKSRVPSASIQLVSLGAGEVIDAIQKGRVDLGIGPKTKYMQPKGLRTQKIFSDSLELLVPRGHPLFACNEISIANLAGMTVLAASPSRMPEMSEFLRRQLGDASNSIDLEEVVFDGDSIEMLMLMRGDPLFIFHHQVDVFSMDCKTVPFADVDLQCDFCAFWKEFPRRDVLAAFAECVVEAHQSTC